MISHAPMTPLLSRQTAGARYAAPPRTPRAADMPVLKTRPRRGTFPRWRGPMRMPTMPAPAGPSRAMAASRTMLENVRVTLLATTMRPTTR